MIPTVLSLLLAGAPPPCDPNVDAALERLKISLQRIEDSIDDINGRSLRKRLRRQVKDARQALRHARDEACAPLAAPPPPPVTLAPPPLPGPRLLPAMDAPTFRALQAGMNDEAFGDGKRDVLETALSGQCLTTDQARWIIKEFDFPRDQLTAARMVAPRIVDRENGFKLLGIFNFSRDKGEMKKILQRPPLTECWGG